MQSRPYAQVQNQMNNTFPSITVSAPFPRIFIRLKNTNLSEKRCLYLGTCASFLSNTERTRLFAVLICTSFLCEHIHKITIMLKMVSGLEYLWGVDSRITERSVHVQRSPLGLEMFLARLLLSPFFAYPHNANVNTTPNIAQANVRRYILGTDTLTCSRNPLGINLNFRIPGDDKNVYVYVECRKDDDFPSEIEQEPKFMPTSSLTRARSVWWGALRGRNYGGVNRTEGTDVGLKTSQVERNLKIAFMQSASTGSTSASYLLGAISRHVKQKRMLSSQFQNLRPVEEGFVLTC